MLSMSHLNLRIHYLIYVYEYFIYEISSLLCFADISKLLHLTLVIVTKIIILQIYSHN